VSAKSKLAVFAARRFVGAVAASVAAAGAFPALGWRERSRGLLRRGAAPAETPHAPHERELAAIASISGALTRARDLESAARPLVRETQSLLGAEFVAVTVVDAERREATGVYARLGDEDATWWRELRLDLRDEPSGIASAVFEGAPVVVYDIPSSPKVSTRLAERTGAKSAAWVPILVEERVVGVVTAATISARRAFTTDEISLLQVLAGEAALVLDRLRSAEALALALQREQAIAAIARKLRGERDGDEIVRVAIRELRETLRLDRVSIDVQPGRPSEIGYDRAVPLSEGERFLVETVAGEVDGALETARILADNDRRIEQQRALLDAAEAVTSEIELDAVLERLVTRVTRVLRADAADCYLYDAEREVLRCVAVDGLDRALVGMEVPAGTGVASVAIQRERPVAADAYDEYADRLPHDAYRGFGSVLVAPISWDGRIRGVLGVAKRSDTTQPFEQGALDVLGGLAGLASVALRNAEVFGERTRQARVERSLSRILALLSEPLSRAETLDAAAHAASDAVDGDFAAVLTADDDRLAVTGAYDLPPELRAFEPPAALVQAAADGRVVAAPRVREDERFGSVWRDAPFESLLAVPIADGLITVFFREPKTFAADDLELGSRVAQAANVALGRSRAFESEQIARTLAQRLAATGITLARELDPVAVCEEVVEQAIGLLGADAGAVSTLEGDELVFCAASGEGLAGVVGERAPSTGWLGGDVVQLRAPVTAADVTRDRLHTGDPVLGLGYRSYLGVPLAGHEGAVQGVLAVYGSAARVWREDETAALAALAGNASVALANAELYRRLTLEHEQSVAILSNVADGIVAVDRDGRVVVWNAAAAQITGVPASEAQGRTPFEVLRRELQSEMGGGNRLLAIMRGADEVWLSLSEAVMRDPAGAVAGRIFAFRDISGERVVEQMKSDFVSTVSHELRTPLTSIYGFAATLLRRDIGFSDEERATFLGYIASESERLTGIVDALIDVARLEAGTLEVELAETDVEAVLQDAVEAAVLPPAANGHRFVVDVDDGVPHVQADAAKLRQVVGQLLENAVKYSPAGTLVRLGAHRVSDEVEVEVLDQGAGIPQAHIGRVFDKFYRGGDSRPGTGLGLFIAQGLVTAMGGRIWVSSADGGGARFTFTLPVAEVQ
jgi:PAS domain S-box-containing protein